MTPEARFAFVLFFFACWCFLGLLAWCIAAIFARGRGALPALPLALTAACAFGVAVPLIGLDNASGFFLSLATAFVGGLINAVGGIALARRVWPEKQSQPLASAAQPGRTSPGISGQRAEGSPNASDPPPQQSL